MWCCRKKWIWSNSLLSIRLEEESIKMLGYQTRSITILKYIFHRNYAGETWDEQWETALKILKEQILYEQLRCIHLVTEMITQINIPSAWLQVAIRRYFHFQMFNELNQNYCIEEMSCCQIFIMKVREVLLFFHFYEDSVLVKKREYHFYILIISKPD